MWVRPRKSKLVPSVSGWRAPCRLCGRKSTRRVLSGWRVSPYRARRLRPTARVWRHRCCRTPSARRRQTGQGRTPLSDAVSPRSRTIRPTHGAGRRSRGRARLHPLAGSPSVVRLRRPSSTAPAFSHLSIILRITPSVTRWSRNARRWECGIESKYLRMSMSSTQSKTLGPQHVLQRAQRLVSRPSRPEAV